MGFISRLVSRLFGFWSSARAEKKIRLSELDAYIGSKTSKRFEKLEMQVFSRFAEVKHILAQIRAELDEFRERNLMEEEGNSRLRKIVSTAQKNLVSHMDALAGKLNPPEGKDFELLRQYCMNSSETLQKEISAFGKSITYTGIIMRQEIKTLGAYIRELDTIFMHLKKLFEENSLLEVQAVRGQIKQLDAVNKESTDLDEAVADAKMCLAKLGNERCILAGRLEVVGASPQSQELASLLRHKDSLTENKESLRMEIVALLGRIDRPLKRFLQAVESKSILIEQHEEALLRSYLERPFSAVKQDPKGASMKRLLREIKTALAEGKISLKEKEQAKRIEALDELLAFNFFDNFYWKLNSIDAELIAVEKKIASLDISREMAALRRQIEELEADIAGNDNNLALLKQRQQKKNAEAAQLREKIESALASIIGEKLVISG